MTEEHQGANMSRALITGGAGFIGSYLSEALLERGWTVEVVDDLSTGSIENISHLKGHPHFAYTLDSVMNRSLMLELVDRADVIFHLAAAVGVRLIVERPVYTIETNIKATELILELAARKRRPLLLASSSEVYQTPPSVPTDENVPLSIPDPLNPRYSYAGSKVISELLALNFGRTHFRRVVIFRPHNVYGPDMGWEHVIPQLSLKVHDLARSSPRGCPKPSGGASC